MACNNFHFTISTAECLDSYEKYVNSHLERPKNQKISFETVIEILQDRGVFLRRQPPVFLEVRVLCTVLSIKNRTFFGYSGY